MSTPNICLAGLPLVLLLGSALLAARRWGSRSTFAISVAPIAAGLVLVAFGLNTTLTGRSGQLIWRNPVAGFESGLTSSASGYSVIGLSLLMALLLVISREASRPRSAGLLGGLSGVAIGCLASGTLGLVVGCGLVWLALFWDSQNDGPRSDTSWLGLAALQTAFAFLLGAMVWQQLQSATTNFTAIPSSTAASAALTWSLAIVVMSVSAALLSRVADVTAGGYAVALIAPLLLINLIRFHQVVDPAVPWSATAVMLATAGLLVVTGVWKALTSARDDRAHAALWWFQIALLLVAGAIALPEAPAALPAAGVALLGGGILLTFAAQTGSAWTRHLLTLTACGSPSGPGFFAAVMVVSALAAQSAHRAYAVVGLAVAVVGVLASIRVVTANRPRPRHDKRISGTALFTLAGFAASLLLCGLIANTILTWLADAAATNNSIFSVILANGSVLPGGIIAVAAWASVGIVGGAWMLLKAPRQEAETKDVDVAASPESAAVSGRTIAARMYGIVAWIQKPLTVVDDWLLTEPRLGTVIVVAIIGLVILR